MEFCLRERKFIFEVEVRLINVSEMLNVLCTIYYFERYCSFNKY